MKKILTFNILKYYLDKKEERDFSKKNLLWYFKKPSYFETTLFSKIVWKGKCHPPYPDHNRCPSWTPLKTTLPFPLTSRHLEWRPKCLRDLPWQSSVALLRNVQRTPKTFVLRIQTCNNPHHMCCRKKRFLLLLPTEMEEVVVLGNRLWLMPPLQPNPTVLKIMVLKSARKPAQVSCKQLASGYVPNVNFLYL